MHPTLQCAFRKPLQLSSCSLWFILALHVAKSLHYKPAMPSEELPFAYLTHRIVNICTWQIPKDSLDNNTVHAKYTALNIIRISYCY